MTDQRAIFIGGCPRSGTTLLASMLAASDSCVATPESQFKDRLLIHTDAHFDSGSLARTLSTDFRFRLWGLQDPQHLGNMPSAPATLMMRLVDEYARRNNRTGWQYWIDHTPENIRNLACYFDQFPDLRVIHIVRDGRSVAASVMPLDWGPANVVSAAKWWQMQSAFGLAAELAYPDRVTRVHYEDLVREPESTLINLCERLDIPFASAMVTGQGFAPPLYTEAQHSKVGAVPDPTMAESWRSRLRSGEVALFEQVAQDFLTYLGYERHTYRTGRAPSVKDRVRAGDWSWLSFSTLGQSIRQASRRIRGRTAKTRGLRQG